MAAPLSLDTFIKFQSFISKESGLIFKMNQKSSFEEKCFERLKKCGIKSFEEYLNFIKFTQEGRNEFKSLLETLTVGETYFFRTDPHFNALKSYVIPRFKKLNRNSVRIWCAGCSTGEEAYSLAIFLTEFMPNINYSIIATDINRNSLARAKEGVYEGRSIRMVSPDYLNSYFVKKRGKYIVSDFIKKRVSFHYHNLVDWSAYSHPILSHIDMIMCRNVTIYFDKDTLKRVIEKFEKCLIPEGFLILGHAETVVGISDKFKIIELPDTFIYQKSLPYSTEQKIWTIGDLLHTKESKVLIADIKLTEASAKREKEDSLENKKEISSLAEGFAALKAKDYLRALPIFKNYLEAEPDDIRALMGVSEIFANTAEYEKALTFLEKINLLDPLYSAAYLMKGVLMMNTGKTEEAIKSFQKVIYLDPASIISHHYLGNLYKNSGELLKAKKEYTSCLEKIEKMDKDNDLPSFTGISVQMLYETTKRALEGIS